MAATGGVVEPASPVMRPRHQQSPRTGAAAAPVNLPGRANLSSSSLDHNPTAAPHSPVASRRHSHSGDHLMLSPGTPSRSSRSSRKVISDATEALAKAQSRSARKLNDAMVYLDGPQVYTCAQCRTHLTSHDEIISKSFHGRRGRAYLFDNCVNVSVGPAEDRRLITGIHSVCDIFCKRCNTMVGWTYARAYEHSQKYKEGKFIIEKINLHLEESDYYDVAPPAGERKDRFRARSISWGSESSASGQRHETIYEYHPSGSPVDAPRHMSGSPLNAPRSPRKRSGSIGSTGSAGLHILR
mmetsp:Transcript_109453/g.306123  ORF Transcript_109453/g.306123 Transcript_109453/m.306123 type:complete len:298 (-) Transcript_109453:136-1029(-)